MGATGVTTTLVDKLPAEYEFVGFTEAGLGPDMLFRRGTSTTGVSTADTTFTTTEDGGPIYEYDPATHSIYIHIAEGVDRLMAIRNNGAGHIRYDVRTRGVTANGSEIPNNTRLTNTVSAENPATLAGEPYAVASSSVSSTFSDTRTGTFDKQRYGAGEWSTTGQVPWSGVGVLRLGG